MAVTQASVDALESALMSGELIVQDGEKRIQYRTVKELRDALDYARLELQRSAGGRVSTRRVALFTR